MPDPIDRTVDQVRAAIGRVREAKAAYWDTEKRGTLTHDDAFRNVEFALDCFVLQMDNVEALLDHFAPVTVPCAKCAGTGKLQMLDAALIVRCDACTGRGVVNA